MRRVVVTGLGIVSPIGNCADEVAKALRECRSGVELISERGELGFRGCLAGTIKGFRPPELEKEHRRQMGDSILMAVAAAREAIGDADLPDGLVRHERTGLIVGSTGHAREVFQQCDKKYHRKKKLTSLALPRCMTSSVSANLSVLFGMQGQSMTVGCACASGAVAIGQGAQWIRWGCQDRVIAGGLQESSWEFDCLFDALRVFSTRHDSPREASRPFEKNRDGLVPAAGAGIVVLEEYEEARRRGAPVYAELIGYGTNSDGYKMTTPSGDGGVRCMQIALADAGIPPEKIDYVNAHATATVVGDTLEARGIAQVLGDGPFVSATKSMTGHEVAAAGSNELIYILLMMRDGFIAPTVNLEEVDEQCRGINHVANEPIDARIEVAISNSFGFGGVNSSLIVRRLAS